MTFSENIQQQLGISRWSTDRCRDYSLVLSRAESGLLRELCAIYKCDVNSFISEELLTLALYLIRGHIENVSRPEDLFNGLIIDVRGIRYWQNLCLCQTCGRS